MHRKKNTALSLFWDVWTSLIIKEIKIKTNEIGAFSLVLLAKIKDLDSILCWHGCEKPNCLELYQLLQPLWTKIDNLSNCKCILVIISLVQIPLEVHLYDHKDVYIVNAVA